jgi:arylsulfatase A-like enzyme
MSPRHFVLTVLASLFLGPTYAISHDHPNVLLIAIDDLNDWVGCLDHAQAKTPNIDQLATRGTLFTSAHCQAPICNPSRTSVMTGLRPSTTGIYVNSPWFRRTARNKDRVTLSQYFGNHGYKTLTAGKIYHGSRQDPRSFEIVGAIPGQMSKLDKRLRTDLPTKSRLWDFGAQQYPEEEFNDHLVASWAVEQLEAKHEKPFFMAIGFYRPHVPFYAPQRFFDKFPLEKVQLPVTKNNDRKDLPAAAIKLTFNPLPPSQKWFEESGSWRAAVQAYYSSVSFTDTQVGRVIEALDQSEYAKNTVIVLWSDHGFHLGEKQRWAKQSLWERSTHVPLIVSYPGGNRNQRCSRPVELLSIYPTLVSLAGLPAAGFVDGRSIQPLLEEPTSQWSYPAITTYRQNNHAVRSERYRYIRYADGSEELYDHSVDSHEWNNIAADADNDAIKTELAKWLPKVNVLEARSLSQRTKKRAK